MKNSISILSVLIALAIVPSISCSAVSKPKPTPVSKPRAKPQSPTVPVIAKPKIKPGTVIWEFATENGQPVNSPALSLDERTVFFGSGHDLQPSKKNGDGLYAIDIKTRKLKWRLFSKKGNQEFRGVSVGPDGKVYTRYHSWGNSNTFIVVDPETQKQFLLNGAPSFTWLSAPSMRGVVFGGNGKNIIAYDVKSGTQQWSYLTKGNVGCGTIIDDGNIIYVGSKDGTFYAIDGKNGSVVWKYQDDRVVSYSSST